MRVIKNKKPDLNIPQFKVDGKLSTHLDDDPLLKHMNKRFIACNVGRPGSGKTSLLISLLTTSKKFKKVFHKIYVFMPATTRESLKNNIFNELPPEQLFEGVSYENLNQVYAEILENTQNNLLSLLIFDDVQSYLKDKDVEKNLLHIAANSRALRTSIFFCIQNFNKVSPNLRKILTDLFLFDISKKEHQVIYDEIIDIEKEDYKNVIVEYNKAKNYDIHSFIYIHIKLNKIFINWDELIFDEE